MRYWFEEPYEAYVELVQLYDRHIDDQSERRFIIENDAGDLVDRENVKAIHIYEKCGFQPEGVLSGEFFVNGVYRDAIRMRIFQRDYLAARNGAA